MKVNDYIRTKRRGFQYPQIARIRSMSRDSGYENQYYIELDHNLLPDYNFHVYEEDIDKSSPNMIDLIKVGDIITTNNLCGEITKIDKNKIYTTCYDGEYCSVEDIKSIITKECFKSMEYKINETLES